MTEIATPEQPNANVCRTTERKICSRRDAANFFAFMISYLGAPSIDAAPGASALIPFEGSRNSVVDMS
jgi:hypothetical protein